MKLEQITSEEHLIYLRNVNAQLSKDVLHFPNNARLALEEFSRCISFLRSIIPDLENKNLNEHPNVKSALRILSQY
jgi:hypothetical protein